MEGNGMGMSENEWGGGGWGYLFFGVVDTVEQEARGRGSEAESLHKGSAAWGGAFFDEGQGSSGGSSGNAHTQRGV